MADATPLKALTLTQPWTSLVAIGAKSIETRSWSTSYRGWLVIHAAKTMPNAARKLCLRTPLYQVLQAAGCWVPGDTPNVTRLDLPFGAIVAVANLHLVERIRIRKWDGSTVIPSRVIPLEEIPFGDYTPGRYAWILTNSRPVKEPIPCRGYQGLWDVPAEIAEQLEKGGYLR